MPAAPSTGQLVRQEQRIDPARTSVPSGTPSQILDEHSVAQVVHALTKLVGPIAPILVKKVRQQAGDLDGLCRLIAERLDSKERQEFVVAVAEIRKRCAPQSASS
jgi:excinuclease UvrABC helicase subunit UvrB